MPWLRVSFGTSADQVEALSEQLGEVGAVAVTVRADSDQQPVLEPAPAQTPLWKGSRLDALFPIDADLSALRGIGEAFGVPRAPEVEFVEDQDWSTTWRHGVVLQQYAGRLSVVPRDYQADDLAGAVLRLDPGMAFGTGSHATTAMCLEALAATELKGRRVADIGCGSGILAVAALLLGAERVLAMDHDPQALLATTDNAAYNGVLDDRLAIAGRLEDPERQYLVLANILANPLIDMAEQLVGMLEDDGALVLSGILEAQLDNVLEAYPTLTFSAPVLRDGWVCVEGTRRSG